MTNLSLSGGNHDGPSELAAVGHSHTVRVRSEMPTSAARALPGSVTRRTMSRTGEGSER
ncbi:hypothetical protein RHCRD62_60331 [Rhodococcus sp. RD6.2]|nr:hypothetical protein RHCRD62_60331 [Rhodococcus sp. RD6.2]